MWYKTVDKFTLPYPVRIISVVIVYMLFMSFGLILGTLFFVGIRLFIRNHHERIDASLSFVQKGWKFFIEILQFLQVYGSIEVTGTENLLSHKNSLIISNHISLTDVVILGIAVPHFNCVVKSSLYNNPFLGLIVHACNFIPNSGGEQFITRCQKSFAHNRPLMIFPQGTRELPDAPFHFQRGAANIIARIEDVTIIPVYIELEMPIFTKTIPWYKIPQKPPHFRATIHPPIVIPKKIISIEKPTKRVMAINRFLENYYEELRASRDTKE